MQKYLSKVIKRINTILKASQFFKIPVDKQNLLLSSFIDPYIFKTRMDLYIEGKQTSEDRLESIAPYLPYEIWLDTETLLKIKTRSEKQLQHIND